MPLRVSNSLADLIAALNKEIVPWSGWKQTVEIKDGLLHIVTHKANGELWSEKTISLGK